VIASVWFSGPRHVELREEVLPPLRADDVWVQSLASAISHGTEMLVFRGQVPPGLELDLPTLRGSFDFPIKYGYASVGRVVEAGAAVDVIRKGDLVFAHHPHQTQFVVPESLVVRLPGLAEPTLGVFLANVETALNVVLDAVPRLGERVLVFGQGVVGLLITQLLRRTGVGGLCVVDPVAHRRALALQVGADTALAPDQLGEASEFDLAIEASGNPAALDLAIPRVAFGGTVIVCSWYGTKPVSVSLGGAFHRRRLRIISSQVSTIDGALQPRWTRERRLALARELLPDLQLGVLVSHRFPFDQAAQAYALVDQHPDETTQVVLEYLPSPPGRGFFQG
jgi:2-desacetyl-2-hydroxyethyl bacteriochlorophyllide A dehydrogenase